MAKCRDCGADMRFAKRPGMHPKERGAFVPLEAEPAPDGDYVLIDDRLHAWSADMAADTPRYHPHRAFCEAAGRKRESA